MKSIFKQILQHTPKQELQNKIPPSIDNKKYQNSTNSTTNK